MRGEACVTEQFTRPTQLVHFTVDRLLQQQGNQIRYPRVEAVWEGLGGFEELTGLSDAAEPYIHAASDSRG